MKTVIITTGYPRFEGDLFGFFVADQARSLVRAGHGVAIIAPADAQAPLREETDGVSIRRVRYAWPQGWQKLAYGAGLVPNLRERPLRAGLLPTLLVGLGWIGAAQAMEADVVHGQWVAAGLVGRLTRWLHGRPVVVTLRGSDLALLRGLPDWLAPRLLRGFDALTAVSQEMVDAALAYGLPPGKVFLTPNGVDTDLFHPLDRAACRTELGLDSDAKLVVWAGRLAPEKGLGDLIEAMGRLAERVPAQLILLGDGPEKSDLEQAAAQTGVEVKFVTTVSRSEMPFWYGAADMVALSSLREGRPNVILEALACGRAVAATAVGGVPELVRDGGEGRLAPPSDPKRLAGAIEAVLSDDQARIAMEANAVTRLTELGLTWEAATDRLERVYRAAIDHRSGRKPAIKWGRQGGLAALAWGAAVLVGFGQAYWGWLDWTFRLSERLSQLGLWGLMTRILG